MIERAARCLEKGGICRSHAAQPIPPRSYRLLHSTFWTHGAGNIDLPSWWIALLQVPQARAALKDGRASAPSAFLDFLLPPKAVEYLQNRERTAPAVFKRQRRIQAAHQRSRAYASLTAEAPLLDSDNQKLPDADNPLLASSEESILARLDQALINDDPQADHSELWIAYLEIRNLSIELDSRRALRLVRCLARSRSKDNQKRLLQLFDSIPLQERRSIHYSHAISAALNHDDIEAAVRLHSEALTEIHVSIGTSSLLSYAIEREYWQIAIETWQTYWNHKEIYFEHPDIWVGVDTIPLLELWTRASSAIDFAEALTTIADSGVAAAARTFALQLAIRSYAPRSSVDASVHKATQAYELKRVRSYRIVENKMHSRLLKPSLVKLGYSGIEKHQELFDKATKLQAPTLELYEASIHQVLSFNLPRYTTQALKYYQVLRENTYTTPTPALLQALLDKLCNAHSEAGMFLIINDYRYYHGRLPVAIYRRAIEGFADQGNRNAVEELFAEFQSLFEVTPSRMANALLHVCYRRGEVKRAVETFEELESRYRFTPDLNSYNAIIGIHARVGDVEGASTWYNRLLDAGLKPNRRTLVPLMAMFAKRGDLDAVKQLLHQSEAYSIETTIAMIDSLVLARVNNGQLSVAETLVNEALQTVERVPQSERTRMWNYLLNAFAMRGDLDKVTELHRRMRANNIPSDAVTFAALMHGLSIKKQPGAAERILTDVMPQVEIPATALHYAICMSGYLAEKRHHKVFMLYAQMLRAEIKPDLGVHNILIRAAAAIDTQKIQVSEEDLDQRAYTIARETFDQAIKDLDPMQLATTDPIKFVGVNRLDDAFTSSYFSYLIFLYGKQKSMDHVKMLYERFKKVKSDLRMDFENSPPIQMLSALMVANISDENFEAVDQCWKMSLSGARMIARRQGAKISEPGWVLPARRFVLNVHLRHYLKSLVLRSKKQEIEDTIKYLRHCGYELDSKSWNMYIRILVQNNQVLPAFEHCEKELMPGWEGWAPSNVRYIKKSLHIRQPRRLEPHRRLPNYETLVYLAAAFVDAQSSMIVKGGKPLSQQLYQVAPKTVDAVYHLPRFNDPLQRRLLNRTT